MLGDGHYFGEYVPTGRAEIVVSEKLFAGSQHIRIIPAKVEATLSGAVPENDSGADIADTRANSGKFPSDVIIGLRLGDEIFNTTGWLNCKVACFPLWDFSELALSAFRVRTLSLQGRLKSPANPDTFRVLVSAHGAFALESSAGRQEIAQGGAVLMPAAVSTVVSPLSGDTRLLEVSL